MITDRRNSILPHLPMDFVKRSALSLNVLYPYFLFFIIMVETFWHHFIQFYHSFITCNITSVAVYVRSASKRQGTIHGKYIIRMFFNPFQACKITFLPINIIHMVRYCRISGHTIIIELAQRSPRNP